MTQVHHRTAVGQWLVAAANDPVGGPIVDRDEFWDMVATTLAAGHEHVALKNLEKTARTKTAKPLEAPDIDSQDPMTTDVGTIKNLFDEYARKQLLDCQHCQESVAFISYEVVTVQEGPEQLR